MQGVWRGWYSDWISHIRLGINLIYSHKPHHKDSKMRCLDNDMDQIPSLKTNYQCSTIQKLLNNAEWLRMQNSLFCLPMKFKKCKQSWNARVHLEEFKWITHSLITISLHLILIFFIQFSWPTTGLHWLVIEMIKGDKD